MPNRIKSVDATRFAMVPKNHVPRSAFDVSQNHKTTFDAGQLCPIFVMDVLPGDSIKLNMTAFCRLATPIVPMMDNLQFESWFFFVPNRLLWENWQRFMGERANPTDTTQFLMPYIELVDADLQPPSVGDYFGLTLNGSANTLRVSALPFRAYNQIWNEWFRDQALQVPLAENVDDGPDVFAGGDYALMNVGKRHDYFTSARPWPNAHSPAGQWPTTSVFTAAPGGDLNSGFQAFTAGLFEGEGVGIPVTGIGVAAGSVAAGGASLKMTGSRTGSYNPIFSTSVTPLVARASTGDWPDIRVLVQDLRTGVMIQQMLERNARGGTRYTELVRSEFGVVSPDSRLQRPELLGGGRTLIQTTPVAQTSASGVAGTTTKLGELAAISSGMVSGHGFSQSFTEHGWLIGLAAVRSYLTYQQGNHRMWNRRTQYDIYTPGLAHLGEQAIYSQEIFADGSTDDVDIFGYQERWSEYKYFPSRTSGYFRSTFATPLDMWHLAENFTARPVLNNLFVLEDPPVDRVSQVSTQFGVQFLMDALFDLRMVRCMPMYSIPGLGARL